MDRLALDTTFLIDLQNEHRGRGVRRGALAFLTTHQGAELLLFRRSKWEPLQESRADVPALDWPPVEGSFAQQQFLRETRRRAGVLCQTPQLGIEKTAGAEAGLCNRCLRGARARW